MKKLLLLPFIFIFGLISAQTDMHWRAVYQYKKILDEKQKARRDSLLKAQPEMADIIQQLYKRFDDRTFYLDFTKDESVYKEKNKLNKSRNNSVRISGLDRLIYKDLKSKTYVEKFPMFQETYLITDSLPDYQWKITGETKKIGNYTVIKAEGVEKISRMKTVKENKEEKKNKDKMKWEEKELKVTAWFTPEIPISNGPEKYTGLPGLILEINREGEVILLTELIINPKKHNPVKKPEKGKIVTKEEFKKVRLEQREKMRKMYKNRRSGKNSRHIRITL